MKTKYFRFLFCGNKGCMMHFGELEDTLTGERFTFLYLYGAENAGDGQVSGKGLFLYPNCVDLVVVGNANRRTEGTLGEILGKTQVEELILPEGDYPWSADLDSAKCHRYLGCAAEKLPLPKEAGPAGMPAASAKGGTDEAGTAGETGTSAEIHAAGWRFLVKPSGEGTLSMAHMPEGGKAARNGVCTAQSDAPKSAMAHMPEGGKTDGDGAAPSIGFCFDDCVMSVKVLDGEMRCCREAHPDGYGCALGCMLRRDYDACKYQRTGLEGSFLAGSLLCGGPLTTADWKSWKEILGSRMDALRFFAFPAMEDRILLEELAVPFKRYYIGLQGDMDGDLLAAIPGSGLYQMPVLLGDGEGICCSGLLRYAE